MFLGGINDLVLFKMLFVEIIMNTKDLKTKIDDLIEMDARSESMDPALIASEYIFRMWGGTK